jgi:hypothetical protein
MSAIVGRFTLPLPGQTNTVKYRATAGGTAGKVPIRVVTQFVAH